MFARLTIVTSQKDKIDEVIKAQLKVRLKHLGFQFGLLANFNDTRLEVVTVRT